MKAGRSLGTTVSVLAALALAACNSASDVLEPSAIAPQATESVPLPPSARQTPAPSVPNTASAATTAAAAKPATPAQTAAVMAKTRLQVAPIVGSTVEAAQPLTAELQTRARQRGITLVGSTDQSATHVLKGYFSAVTEGKDTTVIYVWDVYDPAGNRLHRINGQQKAPTVKGGNGWAGVSPATMKAVADQTVDDFASWLAGSTG